MFPHQYACVLCIVCESRRVWLFVRPLSFCLGYCTKTKHDTVIVSVFVCVREGLTIKPHTPNNNVEHRRHQRLANGAKKVGQMRHESCVFFGYFWKQRIIASITNLWIRRYTYHRLRLGFNTLKHANRHDTCCVCVRPICFLSISWEYPRPEN